ncbi:MAG TPA: serine hydrolase [Gemmatimonadales bacterium]
MRHIEIPALGLAAVLAIGIVELRAQAPPSASPSVRQAVYVPPPGDDWARRRPAEVNFDSLRLAEAVTFAESNPIPWLKDIGAQLKRTTAREPYPAIQGPYKDWEAPSGVVIRHGYIIAEWGDTRRVDLTFSVAKSYLSAVAGLAFDRGLIPDLHRPVAELVQDGGFESEHNRKITWHHFLTQTSEWEGTLWGKPDVADRREGYDRKLREPGSFWEYNDVRVNRTALALLRVWRRPLPEVLTEYIMNPIGASDTWRWYGYYNSYTEQDGKVVQSVSGGTHWGGGFWASTRDHARFGLLLSRRGTWGDRQLLSEKWIALATTPTPIRPAYGYLWWLNTDRQRYPNASARSFFALGAGGNMIWIDPALDLVVVVRWLDPSQTNQFIGKVVAAFAGP